MSMDIKNNLETLFNLAKQEDEKKNLPAIKEPSEIVQTSPEAQQAIDSREYAQTKLKKYIEIGEEMLNESEAVAKSTGEPQAVQAFTNLLKTLGNMTTDVLKNEGEKAKIDKIHKDLKKEKVGNLTQNNTTIIFTGTTSDLLKKANEEKAKLKTIDAVIVEEDIK